MQSVKLVPEVIVFRVPGGQGTGLMLPSGQ